MSLKVRRAVAVASAGALIAGAAAGCGRPVAAQAGKCSDVRLSRHDCVTALRIGHSEARRLTEARHSERQDHRWPMSVNLVDAVVTGGVVTQPNTAHSCTSGSIIHLQLIGTFRRIVVSPPPMVGNVDHGRSWVVHGVNIDIDQRSGKPCLISVRTGKVRPPARASVLFRR